MQHLRSVLINQEAPNHFPHHIGSGYLNIPAFIGIQITRYVEETQNDAHGLFDSLNSNVMQEYVVTECYYDEHFPSIVEDLFVKQVPFLYQYDLDDDYTITVGWIPGINDNNLFFISGKDLILQTPKSKVLEQTLDIATFTNHVDKLHARINLVKSFDDLPPDWDIAE